MNEYQMQCGFEETPAYLFSQTEEQTKDLLDMAKAAARAGLEISFVDELPVEIPFQKVMRIERQAKFRLTEYLFALAHAFENACGVIVQHCKVLDADENKYVDVETKMGKVQSKQLIYATHIPPNISLLNMRCVPYRSYAMAVRLKNNNYPDSLIYDMHVVAIL